MRAIPGTSAARCEKDPAAEQRGLAPLSTGSFAWFALGFLLIAAGLACAEEPTAPSESAADGWRNERWVVEAFTGAMGGGPEWGPVAGVGAGMWYMAPDGQGNLYIAVGRGADSDGEQFVDIVTPDGIRRHLAGSGALGYRDGPAEEAEFRMGVGSYYDFTNIGADDRGNVFVPDNGNGCVRRIFKSAEGKWTVETYAGRGKKNVAPGESCAPGEANLGSNLHVAVARDGTLTIGDVNKVWRLPPDGKTIQCLGYWPDSVGIYGGKPVPKGGHARMNICGGGCDAEGNAYFGARSNDVVCKVSAKGEIMHVAGMLLSDWGKRTEIGDREPLKILCDTPSSFVVDPSGTCTYLCGGDEYDIRRIPSDPKATTATMLKNGRWHVMNVHPNKNRGPAEFDPAATGKPKTEGGTLTNLVVTPLVGTDREGNLYGKMNSWSGMSIDVAGQGTLGTRVYMIRRVK